MTVQSVTIPVPNQAFIGLSSDTKPEGALEWALFIEHDTGRRFRKIQGVWLPDPQDAQVTNGSMKFTEGSPAGSLVVGEVDDITTAAVRLQPAATMIAFRAWFWDRGSAVAKELRVVVGAGSDTDADAKLALAGARRLVNIGDGIDIDIDPSKNIQRVDIASDAVTESGASKVYYEYLLAP